MCVAIAPTGITFATGSVCGDIGIWDKFDSTQIHLFKNAHSSMISYNAIT